MSDFSNDAAASTIRVAEKTVEISAKLIGKFFELIKYLLETEERKIGREMKKAEIERIRQEKDIEAARNYLNQTRGLVKAKYMQAAGKDLYPISQPMSPAELRRFNELAKTYGLNYYTLQNESVIEEYQAAKNELDQINREEKALREQGLAEHKEHLDQLHQEYAKIQTETEDKTFVSPADRKRMTDITKEIERIEDEIARAALPEETRIRKEQLEKEVAVLEKQRNDVIVVVFKEDLSVVENITERMNMEIDLSDIDREVEQIGKKQTLSDDDRKRLAELARQKADIIRGEFDKFNQDNSEEIINAALDKGKTIHAPQTYSFEDALSRVCNRDYAQDPCYICERNAPENYIEAQSEKKLNDEGMPYNDTSFSVYRDGQQLDKAYHRMATLDGQQTSSRGENVWNNIKREMKQQGGFGDDLVIFSSKEDYLRYKDEYNQAKASGAEEIKKETAPQREETAHRQDQEDTVVAGTGTRHFRDYNGMIGQLKSQLDSYGMTVNEQGVVCHSDTMQELDVTGFTDGNEKIRCAEAINIGKQIGVLKKLNDAQTQLAFIDNQQQLNYDRFNQSDQSDGMKALYDNMRDTLHKQSYDIAMTTAVLGSQYARLEDELNDIRSVKIVEGIQEQNQARAEEYENEADLNRSSAGEIPHGEEMGTESHFLNEEQWIQEMEQGAVDISSVSELEEVAERR